MSTEEVHFIGALRSDQRPDDIRLVYADWMEEQGQENRAVFLRLMVELAELWRKARSEAEPYRSPLVEPIARIRIGLRMLCKQISENWLARIHRGAVNQCDHRSQGGGCSSLWEELADTPNPLIRRCDVCKDTVRFCASYEAFSADGKLAWMRFV